MLSIATVAFFLISQTLADSHLVSAGPELDLVLNKLGEHELDLVHYEQQNDEDIVYIRKRSPSPETLNCPVALDCEDYDPWAPLEDPATVAKRALIKDLNDELKARGSAKESKICVVKDAKTKKEKGISFKSHPYPDANPDKFSLDEMVFDFKEIKKPNEEGYYEIGKYKYLKDTRAYATEHILEWHMLKRFLMQQSGLTNKENEEKDDNDEGKEDEEWCDDLRTYWNEDLDFEFDFPVEQKVNKKGNTDRWDKTKKKPKLFKDITALNFVGQAFPGTETTSPYWDEFVILETVLNGRKMQLWKGNSLSPKLSVSKRTGKAGDTKKNRETLQFNLEKNIWYDHQDKTTKSQTTTDRKDANGKTVTVNNNEGKVQGLAKFRDVLGVYKYHQDADVVKFMKSQILRVAEHFQHMDEVVLPEKFKTQNYKPKGYAEKWLKYMEKEYDHRIEKIEEWMETWSKHIATVSQGKSVSNLQKMFQKRNLGGNGWTGQCGTAVDEELQERARLLLKAYGNKGKMKNPIKDSRPGSPMDTDST
ncbi:hypothetical protein BU24DRAFT_497341 [Aaosphaeria arxii CBS 175.79]|uniref:Uncharacterized protein n=1 Tax=Aaosphaeria arxii CBS 175.79 TaxID=1450172 RepID=A0A6A5X874_9PLEO|nr:uncharacterized protein BU24DRAFT_497341 [Aaosphaeria arxii CBS 175.79]KAF2009142.1 hypothetical protein BU24DRAFT_497341 [Aaosphaeria arxii CBS 175.79]